MGVPLVQDDVRLRRATAADAASLAGIYNHYVVNTVVTFEEEAVSPAEMTRRLEEAETAGLPWLAAERRGHLLGYAHASRWKGRCAYRFSVETTIYLDPHETRRGLGSLLCGDLLARLESGGMHAVLAGIALPNEASVRLHEKLGFEQVARFEEVGFKFGRWVDVGYWQRVLGRA